MGVLWNLFPFLKQWISICHVELSMLSWVSLLELGYSLKNISHTWNQAKRIISFLIWIKRFSWDILFIHWLLYSMACISWFRQSGGMLLVLCHLQNLFSHVSPQPGLGLFSCRPSWDSSDGWVSALMLYHTAGRRKDFKKSWSHSKTSVRTQYSRMKKTNKNKQ